MNASPPLVLTLADIGPADLKLVGGKGANLGELTHLGLPVPDGFCLTTAAFRRFMAACPGGDHLYALLDTVAPDDIQRVRRVGEQVRQAMLDVPIPTEIAVAVREAWQRIGAEKAFAVRSSATAEDLPGASFAGQQDTYLNVLGEENLLDAIRRCWASLFTDRAILYRCQNGFAHRDVGLAVAVQQMVMAQKSGILFTADPLTGHRHTLTIDASFGLGEALVGGLVTPDAYRVDTRTREIIARQIAEKAIAIYPEAGGSTRQVALPSEQQTGAVLSDEQILALTEMGCRIAAHYGAPQDIEWAIDGNSLASRRGSGGAISNVAGVEIASPSSEAGDGIYILQARPITSLYPINGLGSPDGSLRVYFSLGHQQNMTRAMSPLSLSSIQILMPIGHPKSRFDNAYVRVSGGRLFADITTPLRHPILRRAMFGLVSQLDALAPEALRIVMRRPEFEGPHGVRPSLSMLKGAGGVLRRVLYALWREDLTGFVARTNARIDAFVSDFEHRLSQTPPGKAQIEVVLEVLPSMFPYFLHWVPQWVAGEAAERILVRLGRQWLSPDDQQALTLAVPGNVVNEMNLSIGDLADLARRSSQLVAWFEHLGDDSQAWLEQAGQLEGSEAFLQAWEDFIARYGARGPAEIDIMMPRWCEEPMPLLRVIAAHLQDGHSTHRLRHQKTIQAREAATQKLLEGARRGPFGRLRTRLVRRLLHVMSEAGGLREHHKFMVIQMLWQVKKVLKEAAAQLVAREKLSRVDDLWFLTWGELLPIWEDETKDWQAVITQRRADLKRFEKLTPPMILTSDGESPVVQYHVDDAPPGALLGNPVSPGVVEGAVRVVHDPLSDTLHPGEILVATFTDPGWTPLFINAGGLVLEIGGSLTHGAVVAREYGIPAVVGARGATQRLQTGQRVRVDGSRGIVEVL